MTASVMVTIPVCLCVFVRDAEFVCVCVCVCVCVKGTVCESASVMFGLILSLFYVLLPVQVCVGVLGGFLLFALLSLEIRGGEGVDVDLNTLANIIKELELK